MLGTRNGKKSQLENEKWKVFVLLPQNKQGLILKEGSEVLYQVYMLLYKPQYLYIYNGAMDLWQDSRYLKGIYSLLEVDQDHNTVRMSKFIENELNCQFEDEKAFYEITESEEDLLYCKKILRPQTREVHQSYYPSSLQE